MTDEKLSELRTLLFHYNGVKEFLKRIHPKGEADISVREGMGIEALEALPELIEELETKNKRLEISAVRYNREMKLNVRLHKRALKAEHARDGLADCCSDLFELVDCLSTWLANAYIDPCLLPGIGRNDIEPPQPEDVIAYAKECIHGQS